MFQEGVSTPDLEWGQMRTPGCDPAASSLPTFPLGKEEKSGLRLAALTLREEPNTLFLGPALQTQAQTCLVTFPGQLHFPCFTGGNPGHADLPLLGFPGVSN